MDPFALLILQAVILAVLVLPGAPVALLVLVTRRGPPLPLVLALGVGLGLLVARLLQETDLEILSPGLVLVVMLVSSSFWLVCSALSALARALQPGPGATPRPRRALALMGGVLAVAAPIGFALSPYVPLAGLLLTACPASLALLAWRSSPTLEQVRADLALLQLAAALCAGLALLPLVPQVVQGNGLSAAPLAFLLPIASLALASLWGSAPRVRSVLWVTVTVGLSAPPLVLLEEGTRTWRALLWINRDTLPVVNRTGALPRELCVDTPAHACPPEEDALVAWPRDARVTERLRHRTHSWVAFQGFGELTAMSLYTTSQPFEGLLVTRAGSGYQLAGYPFDLDDLPMVLADAQRACPWQLALNPSVDWTTQELVSLCKDCALGPATSPCRWEEGTGWTGSP